MEITKSRKQFAKKKKKILTTIVSVRLMFGITYQSNFYRVEGEVVWKVRVLIRSCFVTRILLQNYLLLSATIVR